MGRRRNSVALGVAACAVVLTLVAGCAASGSNSGGGTLGAATSTSTDGATLVSSLCSRCHPIDRVQAAKKDRAGWTATIDRMLTHGLNVDAAQQAAIVDYLTKRDGGQ